jgi:iron(III)-enterobactin esterase
MRRSLCLRVGIFSALLTSACSPSSSATGPAGSGPAAATGGGTMPNGAPTGTGSPAPTPAGTSSGGVGSSDAGGAPPSPVDAQAVGPASSGDSGTAEVGDAASADLGYDGGTEVVLNPGDAGDGLITVGPTYTPSPYLTAAAGAPAGFTATFTMASSMSTIFNGDDFTPPDVFTRQIQVWVPEQYVDGTASPFMVTSDGFYAGIQAVVQNLAGNADPDNSVPPLVVIGIQNGPNVYPNSERSLEYDTVSDRYWRFVTQEVLPAVLANADLKAKFPNFALTSDPNGRGGYGCSSGGPAVMGLAWFGDFNRVFSFSGSFVAIQKTTAYPEGAWEYPQLIAAAPLRPNLRVFLEVGQNDNGSTTPASSDSNWVIANQNMAAALQAKGNHYRFVYALGAGHCDHNARNEVMPDGLVWLWRDYQPAAN